MTVSVKVWKKGHGLTRDGYISVNSTGVSAMMIVASIQAWLNFTIISATSFEETVTSIDEPVAVYRDGVKFTEWTYDDASIFGLQGGDRWAVQFQEDSTVMEEEVSQRLPTILQVILMIFIFVGVLLVRRTKISKSVVKKDKSTVGHT